VSREVAVSGIGIVCPFGTTQQVFVDNLLQGRSAIAPLTSFDTSHCRSTLAAQPTMFQPAAWLPPMRLRRLERTGVYAVAATRLAFEDAGRPTTSDGDDDVGVVLGTWTAGGQSSETYLEALFTGGPPMAPALLFESTVGNAPASLTALEYRLRGPNATISQREVSGVVAIASAVEMLRLGRAEQLLAGAVDVIFETFYRAFDRFRAMSPAREFSRAVAPFDRERTGLVLGDGGVGLLLDSDATRATHGWILGAAESSAAVPLNEWPTSPEPLIRTIRHALADAGLSPRDVHVVYAAANATEALDRVEGLALGNLFGGSTTVVTSIKGAIGEGGVAGALSCAAALLCGRQGRVPPIAGLAEPDAATAGLNLAREATDAPGPIAVVNGVASGGALCTLVLRVSR
jgi:3-oxoacyl-[acyl-carrier-protein] synthase II